MGAQGTNNLLRPLQFINQQNQKSDGIENAVEIHSRYIAGLNGLANLDLLSGSYSGSSAV
jgi:hypothetical protein